MSMAKNIIRGVMISEHNGLTIKVYNDEEKKHYFCYVGNIDNTIIEDGQFIYIPLAKLYHKPKNILHYAYIFDDIKVSKNPKYYVIKFLQPNNNNEFQFTAVMLDDTFGVSLIKEFVSKDGTKFSTLGLKIVSDKRPKEKKPDPTFDMDDIMPF